MSYTFDELVRKIDATVAKDQYPLWTIGVTGRPDERRKEHGNPQHWKQWSAASEDDARKTESYFIKNKGMKGGEGGPVDYAPYVYIF